jgi:hypothetical protein
VIVQRTGEAMMKRSLTAGGSAIALTWFAKPYVDVLIIWQTAWFARWGVTLDDDYRTGILQAVTVCGIYIGQWFLQRVVQRTSDETRSQVKQNEENARLRAELDHVKARYAAAPYALGITEKM